MFDSLPAVLPHAKGGKARVLAVSTAQRVAQLPDVPTVAESGIRASTRSLVGHRRAPRGSIPRSASG